jgi:hypothetical protein
VRVVAASLHFILKTCHRELRYGSVTRSPASESLIGPFAKAPLMS